MHAIRLHAFGPRGATSGAGHAQRSVRRPDRRFLPGRLPTEADQNAASTD